MEAIRKAYLIIFHFIHTGIDKNNLSNTKFLLDNYDKQQDIYINYKKDFLKILSANRSYKIDNCLNKFKSFKLMEKMLHIDRKPSTISGQRLITDYYKSKPKSR